MRHWIIPVLLSTLLFADDISIEDDFLQSLEEVSDIASKTKLNIDDMPSIVTILHGKKLERLGIRSVYEALSLVPGIELSIESSGAKQIIFRGVKEKGKVKLLIDGQNVNNVYRGSIYYYLDFPVELVERIEVIRGPGSVLYGSGAISGVVNIITKNSKEITANHLFATYGTSKSAIGGLHYAATLGAKGTIGIDGYYHYDNTHVDAGPDKAEQYGQSNETLDDYSIGLHVDYDNIYFNSRLKRSQAGAHFGGGNYLESKDDRKGLINTVITSELGYKTNLTNDTEISAFVGYNHYEQVFDMRFLPHPTKGDLIYETDYKEQSAYIGSELIYNGLEHHEIISGIRYEYTEALKQDLDIYFEPTHEIYVPSSQLIAPDKTRYIFSLYVNDTMQLHERVSLVAGVRYDHYNDFGASWSPRAGVIWRATTKLNLKLLYSHSYRAPSWIELYANAPGISIGNEKLGAEKADTVEFETLYRISEGQKVGLNLYLTAINDLIIRNPERIYIQEGVNRYYGGEVQYSGAIGAGSEFSISASYVKTEDVNGNSFSDIADTMADATFSHSFDFGLNSDSVAQYVSERKRFDSDLRDALKGYLVFDQSFSYNIDMLTLRVTLKNLFNTDVTYPAVAGTYENDYPRYGRSGWISAEWSF